MELSVTSLGLHTKKTKREEVAGQRHKMLFSALILGKNSPRSITSNFGAWGITRTLQEPESCALKSCNNCGKMQPNMSN